MIFSQLDLVIDVFVSENAQHLKFIINYYLFKPLLPKNKIQYNVHI